MDEFEQRIQVGICKSGTAPGKGEGVIIVGDFSPAPWFTVEEAEKLVTMIKDRVEQIKAERTPNA